MGKFSRTFSMMRASWEVLKQDKELLVFPLLSAVGCVLVLASFAGPMLAMTDWQAASESVTASTVEALNASDGKISADQVVQMLKVPLFRIADAVRNREGPSAAANNADIIAAG